MGRRYFTERCVAAVKDVLQERDLDLFVVELSLDGMPEFHDNFRVARHAFEYAMRTYDALAELQKEDPRLRIHSISTATHVNMSEIRQLTTYLFDRCPQMDHHNLAIIRGDRKNPTLAGPQLQEYQELYAHATRQPAPAKLPGDLALAGSAGLASPHCAEGVLLHHRSVPVVKHSLSTRPAGARAASGAGVAQGGASPRLGTSSGARGGVPGVNRHRRAASHGGSWPAAHVAVELEFDRRSAGQSLFARGMSGCT